VYSPYHQIVTFGDFLGNVRKLSTKNTSKLENSSNRYDFWKYLRNDLVVGAVPFYKEIHQSIVFDNLTKIFQKFDFHHKCRAKCWFLTKFRFLVELRLFPNIVKNFYIGISNVEIFCFLLNFSYIFYSRK